MISLGGAAARGVITVAGPDRVDFLQGLVSSDVARAAPGRAVWAALLTPQGKYLHDFFILSPPGGGALWLDCAGGQALMGLGRTLRRHVLRADVTLGIGRGLGVHALPGARPADFDAAATMQDGGVLFADPRHPEAGLRLAATAGGAAAFATRHGLTQSGDIAAYDRTRIPLGLPDGARDMEPGRTLLLEAGFDALGGVDWDKGCWMGQELTARTRHRGLVKRRLVPARLTPPGGDGTATPPQSGEPLLAGGREIGALRSIAPPHAMCLLRLDRWRAAEAAGETPATPSGWLASPAPPDWMTL